MSKVLKPISKLDVKNIQETLGDNFGHIIYQLIRQSETLFINSSKLG